MKILKLVKILFTLFVVLSNISCKDPGINDFQENGLPKGIKGYTKFNYQFISSAPYHTQTSMLTGYQNKLYRIGSNIPVQVLDLLNNSWSFISLPDSSFWRWDGASVTVNGVIYVIATYPAKSNDILRLSPTTNVFEHTNVELPYSFHYPAYCTYNNKIIFFSLRTEKVYEYNTGTNQLNVVAANPFYNSTDINLTLSSGRHQNYLYVFGGFHDLPENLFYRLNLENYQWDKLEYPSVLAKKNINGASFNNSFILIADTTITYEYSFQKNEWYVDTSRVPIYTQYGDRGEMSFFAEDSCLYVTEVLSDKVWKVTK